MTLIEILVAVIVLLAGILIGGAGGQALIRKSLNNIVGNVPDSVISASMTAAAAASTTATTATSILTNHMTELQAAINKQGDTLKGLVEGQIEMRATLKGFQSMCEVRHSALEKEMTRRQAEIDRLRGM